jgi:nucleoside-diphosphate-sugar epimerase
VRLLVLGGTWFLGRAVVEAGLRAGHEVAVFNRGRSGPPPAGVPVVHGDRTNRADLDRLAEAGPWDAVVDVPGVVPAQVRDAARALHGATGRYVFVSTVSAYRDWPAGPVSEQSPLHDADPDADPPDWTWGTGVYGPLKAGAEQAVHREFPADLVTILRPGVILGPGEYGSRLTWWLARAARGGQILAPGRPGDAIRPVDVRDVATFLVHLVGTGHGGTFNVAGPRGRDTFGGLVDACLRVTGSSGVPAWVDGGWLVERGVRQWTEIPMWRVAAGTWAVDTGRAEAAGLVCRPLVETVTDTWTWLRAGGEPVAQQRQALHGLAPDREAALLADWRVTDRTADPAAGTPEAPAPTSRQPPRPDPGPPRWPGTDRG